MREGFGVGHRANLQHFAGPSRIHSIQRDLIRLNRVLPAGRPYCLEPASPAPGAALLRTARSRRDIVPFTHLAREGRTIVTIGRRELLVALGGAAAAWPLAARAEQPAMPLVAYLSVGVPPAHLLAVFKRGLAEAGFVEGRNVAIETPSADGHYDRLPALAADLVRRQVAVIVAITANPALAAKEATATIPIVFNVPEDPVELGLVASLARPGGNATGVSFLFSDLVAKHLGLLRELLPRATRIGLLVNPQNRMPTP